VTSGPGASPISAGYPILNGHTPLPHLSADLIHELHRVVRPGLLVRIINKVALHPALGLQSHQQHTTLLIAVAAMSDTRQAYKLVDITREEV